MISQDKIDYIVAHMDERPRCNISRALGVHPMTVRKIIIEHGGKLIPNNRPRSLELERKVIAAYADHFDEEITQLTGASRWQIGRIKKKYELKKSKLYRDRLTDILCSNCHTPESKKKAADTLKKRYRYDQMLINSGMKPQMKYKRSKWATERARCAANYLCRSHNYFMPEGEAYVLCYDEETNRTKNESMLSEKWGFKFVPADEEEEEITETNNN